MERHAQRVELLARPADADAQDEAAPAQPVDIGGHARGLDGMAVGQDDHRRAELDAPGEPGEPGERGERIVERRGVARLHVGRDRHVIGDHQEVVAERLAEPAARASDSGLAPGPKLMRLIPTRDDSQPRLHGVDGLGIHYAEALPFRRRLEALVEAQNSIGRASSRVTRVRR